jgi:hypothetical protein
MRTLALVVLCQLPVTLVAQELKVLAPAPPTRGVYLCRIDSVSKAPSRTVCDVGGDTSFAILNDTIQYVSRPTRVFIPDSVKLFDYWNRSLREAWVSRIGGPPDDVGSSGRNKFVAIWNHANGVRDLVWVTRFDGGRAIIAWDSVDCRRTLKSLPIACK